MLLDKIRTLLLMFLDVSFIHFVLQTFESRKTPDSSRHRHLGKGSLPIQVPVF